MKRKEMDRKLIIRLFMCHVLNWHTGPKRPLWMKEFKECEFCRQLYK